MAGLKSRNKGKRGEREAVKFLKSLGYMDARRTQQYSGADDDFDVECPESLPNVGIEVKFGYPRTSFDLGTSAWMNAIEIASSHAGNGIEWCLLWKPMSARVWRLTFPSYTSGVIGSGTSGVVTVCGEGDVRAILRYLNSALV